MAKGKRLIKLSTVDALHKKSKHRYNLTLTLLLKHLSQLELAKMKMICEKLDIKPYELRDREFKMISNDRTNKRLFRRLKKQRSIYDSCASVLRLGV